MATPPSVAVIVELWTSARRAIAVVEKELDGRLTTELGIPFTTYAVLCTIAELSGSGSERGSAGGSELRQQHIALALGIDKSNVSRHIDAAVASGHVMTTPSATSRRSKSVSLTAHGESTLEAAETLVAEFAVDIDLRSAAEATRFLKAMGDAVER